MQMVLSDEKHVQKKFYWAVIEERYEKVLKPACQKIVEQKLIADKKPDTIEERKCR